MAKVSILLITAALIAGMVGCDYIPPSQNLEIQDWYDLDDVRDNLAGHHRLMNDLDSTTAGYEELAGPEGNEGMGWLPIGIEDDPFIGTFDGQGYEIRDLIMIGSGASHVGVFGFVGEGGQIENVGVVDAKVVGDEVAGGLVGVCYSTVTDSYFTGNVTGKDGVGGLVGLCYGSLTGSYFIGSVTGRDGVGGLVGGSYGTVSNSYAMGTVTGGFVLVGGLLGLNEGTVTDSYATGSVTGYGSAIGGLVGANGWSANGYSGYGTVSGSYSTDSVTGEDDVGGLVGANFPGSIVSDSYATGNINGEREVGGLVGGNAGTVSHSYSTGNVTGNSSVGGLVGFNIEGTVSNSYSTGTVTGEDGVGGLVGANWGTVSNSHSNCNITGTSRVGGLVGVNGPDKIVSNSYSTGSVTGTSYVGGLVGVNEDGTVSNSFWDTQTSGQSTSDGGTGKNTTEMKTISTFSDAGWNIVEVGGPGERNPAYIWNIVSNVTYPFLSWQP